MQSRPLENTAPRTIANHHLAQFTTYSQHHRYNDLEIYITQKQFRRQSIYLLQKNI